MAHTPTVVTSTLPAVGLCAVTLPADGPSIRIHEMYPNSYIVAYDRNTWTRDQIDGYVRLYLGNYELVEPANGGA